MVSEPARKILIVEDDAAIREALEVFAQTRGYEVHSAADGLTAVGVANDVRPDVILLDIALPDLDGRDVLVRLNESGVGKEAVVIFVTARDSQSDRLVGLELGADDYETKPLRFSQLFSKIERLLEKRREGGW